MVKGLHLAVLLLTACQAYAWINGGDFTKEFERCTGVLTNEIAGGKYEQQCTDLLIPLDASHKRIGNFTDEQMNYLQSLFRQMFLEGRGGNRVKRHAGGPWRFREEIRANNGKPFQKYAEAIIGLTKSGRYDFFAQIHVTIVSTAHFGPNFLPWHRLYLLTLETALGVPIPYWDSTEDIIMKKPEKSVVWSKRYFGNGWGVVRTGPFANFQSPLGPIFRKINAWGSLLDRPSIFKYVLSQVRLGDISSPTAKPKSNLEYYHNDVHAWVNGLMGNLGYSAYDPVFHCLHSMIDNIWELFRKGQAKQGINPETDFVKTSLPGQSPKDKSGIEMYKNFDGLSNKVASQVIYAPLSQCPICQGSSDKYCDQFSGSCVSRARFEFESPLGLAEADKIAKLSGLGNDVWGQAFRVSRLDERVRGDPVQSRGLKLGK